MAYEEQFFFSCCSNTRFSNNSLIDFSMLSDVGGIIIATVLSTASVVPPRFEHTTGVPQATDSARTLPHPSW